MIDGKFAENILIMARKSKEKISEAIRLFESFLSSAESLDLPKYYLARNQLRDGQLLLEETLNNVKKLLGPQPEYSSEEIKEMRMKFLRASGIIVESQTIDGLEAELLADEYLKSFMNPDEVVSYVREAGKKQTTGRRKLRNFKVRMVIDQLVAMRIEAQALQKRASEKIQTK